jgi:hypothetical protein
VTKALQQLQVNLEQLECGRGLVALHLLLDQLRPRLQAVLDMAASRPHALATLKAAAAGAASELLNCQDEMVSLVCVV